MKRFLLLALALTHGNLLLAAGSPPQPKSTGIESPEYVWNAKTGELAELLKLQGDAARGRTAYQGCQGCHRPDAFGLADGTYPQLAGQHVTVLLKQMADVREGRRDNPKMFPFSGRHVVETQEIADIAVFLNTLPLPTKNDKGPGSGLARGKELYERDCLSCHGRHGEGNADKFYPVTAGQHYRYLLRQIVAIRDGERRNANPRMVEALSPYTPGDMDAVADYMSRLTPPEKP